MHIHQHNTRNKDNMHLTNINLTKVKKRPYSSCIRMLNHLPNNINSLDFNIKKHKKFFSESSLLLDCRIFDV
jgi:hypothetical protein